MHDETRLQTKLGGEAVTLLAERALYWAREATLFVADPHLGKSASFQAAGMPVPAGATLDDLARLTRCLQITKARRLVILGDLFHTRASQSPSVLSALADWRRQHPAVDVTLVMGNHDLHAGPPPPPLAFDCVAEPCALDPFVCYHHPPEAHSLAERSYALAGHLHPVAMLRDVDGSRLRLPCFHVGPHAAVLPAFGTFTGGHAVRPRTGDRVFVLGEGSIAEVIHDARNPSGAS